MTWEEDFERNSEKQGVGREEVEEGSQEGSIARKILNGDLYKGRWWRDWELENRNMRDKVNRWKWKNERNGNKQEKEKNMITRIL